MHRLTKQFSRRKRSSKGEGPARERTVRRPTRDGRRSAGSPVLAVLAALSATVRRWRRS